ncbi:ABC transporter substrate-binding protein [Burkholderia sp. 22PA0106]|uniref:ABC transporter substrate-binding protein n=1 Tax=Burkholderia sp. 22PA0106 TaxID=3237371 RepID=UPI0039C14169
MLTRRGFLRTSATLACASSLYPLYAHATPQGIVVLGEAIDGIVNGFDPAEAYDASADILPNMYRALMGYDPSKPGGLAGDLAEHVEIAPNGLEYRFTLRGDARFDSGAPVTAQDVAYSLQRAVKLNKSPSFLLTQIGLSAANADTAVRAVDAKVVTITLPRALASGLVLATLSTTVAGIVEQKVVMQHEVDGDMGNLWLRKHSAGAGAYRLLDWQAGSRITLAANPSAAVQPKVPRLVIRHMAEPSAELLQLQKGDLDIARTLGSDELRAASADKSITVTGTDALTQIYLQMNMAAPMFQKREVLQAVKWAIDYEAIAQHVTPGLWASAQAVLPKGTPGALTDKPFHKDVAKAKALLAKAGFADGFTVTLDHPNIWPYPDIAQAMQADLAQVGIRLQLLAGDYAQVLAKRRARKHQMQLGRFAADHLDPSSFVSYFVSNPDDSDSAKVRNGAWNNHFVDAKLTAASAAADRELDPARRLAIYQQIQRDFWETAPIMFMLQKRNVVAVRAGVTGLSIGPIDAYTHYSGIRKS